MNTYGVVLAALADPTRRQILETLRHGPSPVGELAAGLPVSRAAVSQHLRVLREAGLVSETAEGTRRIYRAEAEGLAQLRAYLESYWGEILKAYEAVAEEPAPRIKRRKPRRESKK